VNCEFAECLYPLSLGYECSENPPSTQFYFNVDEDACLPFVYKGCGGNENRFLDNVSCDAHCYPTGDVRPSPDSSRERYSESIEYETPL